MLSKIKLIFKRMCLEFEEVKIVMCNRKRISGHKYMMKHL